MSQTRANLLMLIASFIWGTAFVSQTTGMGTIGPCLLYTSDAADE
mgnify:CR=1 FL=1